MPQVFRVLRCYKCSVFQIHQTKKSNKFQCKMCGEKQSIKRHYGLGNGLECRKHVQRLNAMRGEIDNSKCLSNYDCSDEDENLETPESVKEQTHLKMSSKWSDFVETEEIIETPSVSTDTMYLNSTEVVLELPRKRQKLLGRINQQKNRKKLSDDSKSVDLNNTKTELTPQVTLNESNICDNYDNKLKTNASKFRTPLSHNNLPPNSIKKENTISNVSNIQIESKWSGSEFQSSNNTNHIQRDSSESGQNILSKERKSCFVPPAINKNSKWAKFAAEDIELPEASEESINPTNESNEILTYELLSHEKSESNYHAFPSISKNDENDLHYVEALDKKANLNDPQALFALCDEEDIDDYLSI